MGGKKDDKTLQELPIPDRLKWVPEEVRGLGPGYDVGQMWVKFAEAIRTNTRIEPDFDSAVRRHRMLDAIVLASQMGQRQKVTLHWNIEHVLKHGPVILLSNNVLNSEDIDVGFLWTLRAFLNHFRIRFRFYFWTFDTLLPESFLAGFPFRSPIFFL